jgi:two-component system phosphate regulon sensor histidine kinase PhoR
MLAGRYRGPEQLHSYLKQISNEGERLTHLIDNFLAFSRMERGKHHFRFVELDLNALVDSVADAARQRFQPQSVDFQVEVKSKLPVLRADEDGLTTVLVNLLGNACKYSSGDKRIILRAYADPTQVTLEVQDNGIGLSDEERSRVFERFYQADQSLTRRGGGCGLGLSIVQYIIRAHQGSVEVESEPGKGSLFRVRMPLTVSDLSTA